MIDPRCTNSMDTHTLCPTASAHYQAQILLMFVTASANYMRNVNHLVAACMASACSIESIIMSTFSFPWLRWTVIRKVWNKTLLSLARGRWIFTFWYRDSCSSLCIYIMPHSVTNFLPPVTNFHTLLSCRAHLLPQHYRITSYLLILRLTTNKRKCTVYTSIILNKFWRSI